MGLVGNRYQAIRAPLLLGYHTRNCDLSTYNLHSERPSRKNPPTKNCLLSPVPKAHQNGPQNFTKENEHAIFDIGTCHPSLYILHILGIVDMHIQSYSQVQTQSRRKNQSAPTLSLSRTVHIIFKRKLCCRQALGKIKLRQNTAQANQNSKETVTAKMSSNILMAAGTRRLKQCEMKKNRPTPTIRT